MQIGFGGGILSSWNFRQTALKCSDLLEAFEATLTEITREFIADLLEEFFARSKAIQEIGGISYKSYMEGAKIPDGWILDRTLDYFVPPNLSLSKH
jgi:hypothetical protein